LHKKEDTALRHLRLGTQHPARLVTRQIALEDCMRHPPLAGTVKSEETRAMRGAVLSGPRDVRLEERAARLGLSGAMITEYPAEDRRYDQPEYEPFWAAAAALGMPLSLHTATRRQGKIRGAGPGTLRDASSRATKAFYPALSMCDMIFSGVFERHPRLTLAIVEFELAWAPNVLTSMDYTYRERHGEALYRFKNGMLPSDFFRRNVILSFQEDAIGIRLRDVIGVDNMMWSSDYPQRVDVPPIAQDPL